MADALAAALQKRKEKVSKSGKHTAMDGKTIRSADTRIQMTRPKTTTGEEVNCAREGECVTSGFARCGDL